MTNTLKVAGQTDVGRLRKDNQDTFISQPLWSEQDALLVVIDGVGGYAGGAEAAALAKDAISQYMAAPTGDTLTMLREAVVYANNQIVREKQHNPALARMCCVLTAAVADADTQKLLYVHVGDTRLYRFRGGQLVKLTRDHSLVGMREDAGQLTEKEAMRHPRRNEILRDVGSATHRVDDADFLESGETDFLPGDELLLCSDGLTDRLTQADLLAVLGREALPDEQITDLIGQANEAGGQDNITVVLARFPASVPAPAPPRPAHVPTPKAALPERPPEPVRSRTWLAVLGGILVVVALFLWQRLPTTRPATVPPAAVDTTARTTPPPLPDSARINPSTPKQDSARRAP